jgi:hemoglobin/transferrin/lactoferrin receptor protein
MQTTDAIQNTVQERTSYSFINPMNPATYSGSLAIRDTDFEFNQETTALNLNLRKSFAGGSVSHALAYGLNWDDTQTERPRNRCDQQVSSGTISCAIPSYPFAQPEVFPNKTFPDSSTERFGVYVQDEISFGDGAFSLIPGVRFDRYELDPDMNTVLDGAGDIEQYGGFAITAVEESEVSLSLGAIYDFNESYSLFAQYAEGYRPPNFDESNQAFVNLGHGYATVPNPALRAESSQGFEVGLRARLDNAFLSFAAYHNRYEDFIESSFVGSHNGISLFQDQNLGEAEIRGVEATANVYLTSEWQLRSSIAYSRGDNEADGTPLDSIEPLTAVFGLGYDVAAGNWGGELLLTTVAEKDRVSAADRVTADAYTVADLVGYYRFTDNATLRLGVFNLFDETYARWTNIQGVAAASTDTLANAAQPGTNFRLGFNLQF